MGVKTCKICNEVKSLDAYPRHSGRKDGHGTVCKICDAKRAAAWREAHPGANAKQSAKWRSADPERAKASDRTQYEKEDPAHRKAVNDVWRKENAAKLRKSRRAWKKAHPKIVAVSNAESRRRHPEPARASARRSRKLHPEKQKAATKRWMEKYPGAAAAVRAKWARNNRDKCCAYATARKAKKLQATPVWANKAIIDAAYAMATAMTKLTGVKYHVDHVVPLRSKIVCGLHTDQNLAIILARGF